MQRISYQLVSLAVVVGLLLAACGVAEKAPSAPASSPAQQPASLPAPAQPLTEWDKVLAAAKREGTVTVYNGLGGQLGEALKEGMKKYGIRVETIGGQGGELQLKIEVEQRAKAYAADLFVTGWRNNADVVKAGYGQTPSVALPSLEEKGVWRVYPSQYEPTKTLYAFATSIIPDAIINTELVRKGDIQSWQDLVDPKWREKMVMYDPRLGSGAGAAGMGFWGPKLGEDFWRKMAAQRIIQQTKSDLPVNQVAYGEKSVAIFPHYQMTVNAIKAGAPIQLVQMKEGTPYFTSGANLVRNAPHSNAAMVLLDWMFTKEGQSTIGRAMEGFSIRSDLAEDWIKIAELRPGSYTLLEPNTSLDPEASRNGAEFATRIFGAR